MVWIEPLDLGDAVSHLLEADAEPAGQLVAKVGLIDRARGFRMLVEGGVVKPRPAPLGIGRVGDEDMGMEVGIAGAGGAVDVGGAKEAVALEEFPPAFAAPRPAG